MVKKVRSLAISGGVTLAILAGLAILASRTNAGNFLLDNLRGFGQNVGAGIVAPFTGIVSGINEGGQGLFGAASDARRSVENVLQPQNSTGRLGTTPSLAIQNLTDNLSGLSRLLGGGDSNQTSQSTIDISNISRGTVERLVNSGQGRFVGTPRLSQDLINIGVAGNPESPDFGGFGNAANQQAALQRLIEENKKKFPQFFQ